MNGDLDMRYAQAKAAGCHDTAPKQPANPNAGS